MTEEQKNKDTCQKTQVRRQCSDEIAILEGYMNDVSICFDQLCIRCEEIFRIQVEEMDIHSQQNMVTTAGNKFGKCSIAA